MKYEQTTLGLFKNTYDFFLWHDLICVSDSARELEAHHKKLNCYPIMSGDQQLTAHREQIAHYVIEPVLKI